MLFSSTVFIFIFLPIIFMLCLISKQKYHNIILLVASLFFYGFEQPKYVLIIISVIFISYIGAICIDKLYEYKKPILVLTIVANLSFLIFFKYINFIIENINLLNIYKLNLLKLILPIGISFYIFQALSYIIDVYRGEVKVQKNIFNLALYICLFPQLVAGPIIKYHDIEDAIISRKINIDDVSTGIKRFIIGLSKKVLIANTLGLVADKIFCQVPSAIPHLVAWIGAFAYTFQLFFDFSGYSDMAIGLGMIFGFKFMENFNYPYISKSVTEFWRRWHISLSTWFKQYVYIPLGGNKEGKIKTVRNLGIVFLITGLWHGASWTFIVWGLWHGLFIIIEKLINIKNIDEKYTKLWQNTLRHFYCLLIVVIGWVIFRSDNLTYAIQYISNMFGLMHIENKDIAFDLGYYVDTFEILMFVIAILCSVPIFKNILQEKGIIKNICLNIWFLILFVLSVSAIVATTYNPFLYFKF